MESVLKVGHVDLPYRVVTGEVVEVRLLSETHVSGYGGGGGTDQFGNINVSPINVNSRVRNRAHVVVKWDTGLEGSLETAADFTVRTGHRVVAIHISYEGHNGLAYVYNRDTGQFWVEPWMGQRRRKGIVLTPVMLGFAAAWVCVMLLIPISQSRSDPGVVVILMFLSPILGIVFASLNVASQNKRNRTTNAINSAFRELAPRL